MKILQKLTARERKILYVVFGLLILILIYHGVWIPLQNKFAELDREIFAMQMKLRKAHAFLSQKTAVMQEAQNHSNLQQMDAGSDEEEIAKLLNFIEQQARGAGISISDLKPQPPQSDKITKRLSVELNAESSLEQLVGFIYQLEHSQQLLKVQQISTTNKDEKSTTLKSFMIITRYMVK